MTRDRVRALVGGVLALAVLVSLGWMWWGSRLPATYSAMEMGYVDYGGGPHAPGGHMTGMHESAGTISVDSLDTPEGGTPDVAVELVARAGRVRLASGTVVDGYTVNGTSPGPVIRARVGDLVEIHLHNDDVAGGVALHWHGVDVPNAEDGVAGITQDAVRPGGDHTYRWVAPHAGTYWYHSHQLSHEQVARGLLGAIVISPARPEPDVVDVVEVAHLYDGVQTLNGEPGDQSVVARPGQRVRVRVVNTDNGPQTAWADVPYRLVALDGYDVHEPGVITGKGVDIPAGGRADLELTAPADGSGTRVGVIGGPGIVVGPSGATAPRSEQPERDVDLLAYGRPAPSGLDTSHVERSFDYSIGRRLGFVDGRPGQWWSINGHLYPDMPMFVVREGDVVKITVSNHSGEVHPMHLHGHHALVLSRDGQEPSGSPWWFDTLDVRDGETYVIAFLADNPGVWMDHCHNLQHAAQGMVTHLMYEGVSTPYELGSGSGNEPE